MIEVRIKSGFKSGGELLRWDGGKFAVLGSVSSCTWQGDADDTQTWELEDSFRGAAVRWHTDGYTRIPAAQLLGFTAEELSSPSPVQGWGYSLVATNAAEWRRLADYGQYLRALAEHGEDGIREDSAVLATARQFGGGRAVAELPCEWGWQVTAHFAVFQDCVFMGEEQGCGNDTPYLTSAGDIEYPGW